VLDYYVQDWGQNIDLLVVPLLEQNVLGLPSIVDLKVLGRVGLHLIQLVLSLHPHLHLRVERI
jgi:hypothetical protein